MRRLTGQSGGNFARSKSTELRERRSRSVHHSLVREMFANRVRGEGCVIMRQHPKTPRQAGRPSECGKSLRSPVATFVELYKNIKLYTIVVGIFILSFIHSENDLVIMPHS